MNARAGFEEWLRSEARVPARKAGTADYADERTQSEWVLWQRSWNTAMAAAVDESRCWIPRTSMRQIHSTLEFYANPKSYERSRSGGLLQSVLAERPTAATLVLPAKKILAAFQDYSR